MDESTEETQARQAYQAAAIFGEIDRNRGSQVQISKKKREKSNSNFLRSQSPSTGIQS